ncbi:HAD-IIIA family hydrolase [Dyadobacter sp. CY326]|uniref:D-glycero-alpha-D-manno-heptose-1,7-bisphosphate 7-phosphatase n=1 Tax=Dyadobacter sp. CY326 TaxID=2907300 RepID=UPI001F26B91E|nr:HAD family hydrolase [Dyadobacter sp. CY326]MCE7064925.1 HAD family hydrolase [Dyadobacter sp. CY326]
MQSPDLSKAVFLDKDGTLIIDVPYNADPEKVRFEKGVFEGLAALQANGFKLVIISNQPGLALGKFTQAALDQLIVFFEEVFRENDLVLSGFYYCPHLPTAGEALCNCRKPKPGMLLQAAYDLHIDLKKSWMIGDILNDVEAGKRAGCQSILINNGNETEWLPGTYREPDFTSTDFFGAAEFILEKANVRHV